MLSEPGPEIIKGSNISLLSSLRDSFYFYLWLVYGQFTQLTSAFKTGVILFGWV